MRIISGPITNHDATDNRGVAILADEANAFWKDDKDAKVNSILAQTLLQRADLVVVKFGNQYKQWNVAFDVRYATLGSRVNKSASSGNPINRPILE